MDRRHVACLPLLFAIGCGGDSSPAPAAPSKPAETAASSTPAPSADAAPAAASTGKQKWDGSQGVAEVKGVVRFSGTAPTPSPLDMAADPACHAMGHEVTDPKVIVNDGMLQNAFVYVSKGLKGWDFDPPSEPAILTQKGCMYEPHVLGVMAGQTLSISNEDDVTHNVHTYSKRNAAFNKSQPAGAPVIEAALKRDEKQFPVKCDIHAWMSSYVTVVDNPFFAVSDASGAFSLGELPAGEYTITVEHENFDPQKAEITVSESGGRGPRVHLRVADARRPVSDTAASPTPGPRRSSFRPRRRSLPGPEWAASGGSRGALGGPWGGVPDLEGARVPR